MSWPLPRLEVLYLPFSGFSGNIPSVWNQCKVLTDVDLSKNKFNRGQIPNDIESLSKLHSLYLDEDNLEGEIPLSLLNISALRVLSLEGNNLHGKLPQEMCHKLPSLESIYWDGNQFMGSIPQSISNCTLLEELYLGDNFFTEFGSKGIISTKVYVYSFGIMLMEAFTRKKPANDMFDEGLGLKGWISGSFPHAMIQVVDSNLLQGEEKHSIDDIVTSTSSIFELALSCCTDFPEGRISMIDVVAPLNRIKIAFMQMRRQDELK